MKTALFLLVAALGVLAQEPDPVESTASLCPDGSTCPTEAPTMTPGEDPNMTMTLDEPLETGTEEEEEAGGEEMDHDHEEGEEDMDHDHSTMTGDMDEDDAEETGTGTEEEGADSEPTETPGAAAGLGFGMAALVGAVMVAL